MPGTSFTQQQIRQQFDLAIDEGSVDRAWSLATRLDPVPIDRALALMTLLGRQADLRFDAAALRFVERFVGESRPSLTAISKTCDALATVRRVGDLPAMSEGAARALGGLGRQLRQAR